MVGGTNGDGGYGVRGQKGASVTGILIFGASGQLGTQILASSLGKDESLIVAPRALRLVESDAVVSYVKKHRPEWVVNAGAMTDVDAAHLDPERALQVNGLAPGVLAGAAQEVGARVIHISSEAVYDGSTQLPYTEADACRPVSVYGVSKLTGDLLTLAYSPESYVLRTSWLYSGQRGSNFPTRSLDQLEEPGKELSVVTDIVGNPTPASLVVDAIHAILRSPPDPGLYHVCARGPASKFDWAVEIAAQAGFDPSRINPVSSEAYPTVARRPKFVDLDCSKFRATELLALPTWRDAWLSEISTWKRRPGALDPSSANA